LQAPATTGLFRTVGYGGDSAPSATLRTQAGTDHWQQYGGRAILFCHSREARSQTFTAETYLCPIFARRDGAARDIFLHPKPATDLVWLQQSLVICSTTVSRTTTSFANG